MSQTFSSSKIQPTYPVNKAVRFKNVSRPLQQSTLTQLLKARQGEADKNRMQQNDGLDSVGASQCSSTSSQQTIGSTASQTTGYKRPNLKQSQHAANLAMVDPRCFPSQRPASQASACSSIGSQNRSVSSQNNQLSQPQARQDSFKQMQEFSANWLKNNSKETKIFLDKLESKTDTVLNHVQTIARQQTELACSMYKIAVKETEEKENVSQEVPDDSEKSFDRLPELIRTEISRVVDEGFDSFLKKLSEYQSAKKEGEELVKAEEEKIQAERERAQAEKEKAQAEKEKVQAEKEKAQAEKQKAQAEKEKIEAMDKVQRLKEQRRLDVLRHEAELEYVLEFGLQECYRKVSVQKESSKSAALDNLRLSSNARKNDNVDNDVDLRGGDGPRKRIKSNEMTGMEWLLDRSPEQSYEEAAGAEQRYDEEEAKSDSGMDWFA